ncbi:MAG: sigma-70 family RNA polymerase sigma factor [Clostridiales Family XIII bacterium]|jgi:RNA polymerase sigma-70 factor (ECF subfamily)|nr:sigma-70 family RNA polymerase sigma factor [Clostridiales Family XIII bacterium]
MENDNTIFFEKLYRTHKNEIAKFIYAMMESESTAADDIFQCVWRNAFRYLDSLENRDKARAWLYAIARTEIKHYFSKRTINLPIERGTDDEDSIFEEPEDMRSSDFPQALADADLLIQLLNQLDISQQRIVILYYYYDMSLKDIAETRHENYNTVKSLYRRAMAKLRVNAKEIDYETL